MNKKKASDSVVHVPKHLFSRILYTNPVCLLSTRHWVSKHTHGDCDEAEAGSEETYHVPANASAETPTGSASAVGGPGNVVSTEAGPGLAPVTNVMTITWLTAASNRGDFVMSLNARRHTVGMLRKNPSFGALLVASLVCDRRVATVLTRLSLPSLFLSSFVFGASQC